VYARTLGGGRGAETAGGDARERALGAETRGLDPGRTGTNCRRRTQSPVHGAVVEDVQPGSPADNAGLQRGDVIMEVNRHSVKSAAEVAQVFIERAERSGMRFGAGVVKRGQHFPRVASFAGLARVVLVARCVRPVLELGGCSAAFFCCMPRIRPRMHCIGNSNWTQRERDIRVY